MLQTPFPDFFSIPYNRRLQFFKTILEDNSWHLLVPSEEDRLYIKIIIETLIKNYSDVERRIAESK